MDRRRDKQAPKFRSEPSPKQLTQDEPRQAYKKTKEIQKSGRDFSIIQDKLPMSSVSSLQDASKFPEVFRHFDAVGTSVMAGRQSPMYMTDPRVPNVISGMRFGEQTATKKERDVSPSGEPPPQTHTTKSSSLSRDISPSRITAQVQSAMSESTQSQSQPLLLSALQGKMAGPMIRVMSPKAEAHSDTKPGVAKQTDNSALRSSPHAGEMRHSPVQVDSRVQIPPREIAAQTPGPFEHLLGALAASRDNRIQPGQYHVNRAVPPNNHQQAEGRNRTPSPKPFSPSPSQRNVVQPTQRWSPVATGSRVSPSAVHEMVSVPGKLSGGMTMPVPHRGLVQQHLLASTLVASSPIAATNVSAGGSTQPGRTPFSSASPFGQVPSAPSAQSTVRLSTIPLNTSTTMALQREKVSKSATAAHSVMSVGTGTESKQYASQGAQTKHVPGSLAVAEGAVGVKSGGSTGHPAFHRQHPAGGGSRPRESGGVMQQGSPLQTVARDSSPHSVADVNKMRTSPVSVASVTHGGNLSTQSAAHYQSIAGVGSKAFIPTSSAVDLNRLQTATVVERKRRSPSPTPAHSNKPIPVPSSTTHIHSHVHHAHPTSKLVTPTATSTVVSTVSPVNHITTAPVLQPVVSLCRLPVTTEQLQPQTVRSKADTMPSVVSTAHGAVSTHYQPKHHYNQHTQPAQTITSQTREPGPVVKDFVPVAGSPEPHPFHQPPLPPHVNPFTFPTTGIQIHYHSGDRPSYTISSLQKDRATGLPDQGGMATCRSVSDVTEIRQHKERNQTESQEMPRLTSEKVAPQNTTASRTFNHVEAPHQDGKEKLLNPFNMRLQNLSNFPSINTTYRSAYRSHSVAVQRAKACSITSAAKSLDLLRQNIQKSINKELDQVVQKYVEKFFQPAAANIRLNNGANSVSEEHINAVCRQIFEEAKRIYTTEIRRSVTPVGEIPDNISESGSINGHGRRVSPNPLKRSKVSDSDSEKGSDGGFPKKVVKRKGRPPLHASGRSTPLKPIKSGDQVRRDGPKWDPERIKPDALFVMGARANKALGLGNTRGRLYIRHPDVFKYSGDQDDKVWLHEQKLMPATGGKAYMLLVEDIIDLSKTEEYRDSPTLMMHECRGFQVPEWMLVKIKEQMWAMRSDSKRSRSHSPVVGRPEPPKTLPFATFSDTASNNDLDSVGNKNSLQPSPADTEEMEFLSTADNDDTQPADASPFGVTGGFDDGGSPSSSHLDTLDESSVATPFS